jgi:hypothetical protein
MAKLTKDIKKQLAETIRPKIPELAYIVSLIFAYAPITASIGGEAKILDRMSIEHIFLRLLEEWEISDAPVLSLSNFYIQASYNGGWEVSAGYAIEVKSKL